MGIAHVVAALAWVVLAQAITLDEEIAQMVVALADLLASAEDLAHCFHCFELIQNIVSQIRHYCASAHSFIGRFIEAMQKSISIKLIPIEPINRTIAYFSGQSASPALFVCTY